MLFQAVRQLVPDMPVIARAHDLASARNLHGAGATDVVPEAIEASLQLAGSALRHHGRDAQQVEDCLAAFRTKAEESASARQ